jgi:hypothetical protein
VAITNKSRQVSEIIKCGKDPVYFFNKYVKIQHPVHGLIPFNTYPFQDECVHDFIENRFSIILKSRQLGLSTLTAAYATWMALYQKDKNILIIATKLSVAQNFIKKVKTMIRSLPKWLVLPTIVTNNKQLLEFSHGSSIKAIPTSDDAGRSEALSLLIIDEAAFVRNFDELWTGLYPTISTGGRVILLSTPNGVGGQYHEIYVNAEAGLSEFKAIKLPWDVHPERDDEWFEKETRNFSERKVAQEYLCDFATSGETFLTNNDLESLRQMITSPIDRAGPDMNVWIWKYPLSEHKYILSADVSRGDSKDFSTFHIIDVTTDEVVVEYKGKIPPDEFASLIFEFGMKYSKALVCPENNSYGYATILKLKELEYPALYYRRRKAVYIGGYVPPGSTDIAGFTTSGKTRNLILTKLEEVIRNRQIAIYSSRFHDEMKTFIWRGNKAQAMKGNYNDDLVMSLAIGVWLYDSATDHSKGSAALNQAMLDAMSVSVTKSDRIPTAITDNRQHNNPSTMQPVSSDGKRLPGATKWSQRATFDPEFDWVYK